MKGESTTQGTTQGETYICYSKSVKPGITRNPWSFQWLHEISTIMRDFMKSLFISSDYMKSLKKQALNFILLLVSWLSIWNLFMGSHAIIKVKAQLNVQMQKSENMLVAWMADNESQVWTTGIKIVQFPQNCAHHSGIMCSPSCIQPCFAVKVGLD